MRRAGHIVTGRVAEAVAVHPVVPPVPRSDFALVGRDTPHASPHRWLFEGWNDAEILAIQAPNFLFPSIPSAMVIPGSPQPGMRPENVGMVIQAPNTGSWSAMATLRPPAGANLSYLKLMPTR